jgi:hypothetical protein
VVSIEIVEEFALKKCDGLERCVIDDDSNHATIGKEAFADCPSLRSFSIPIYVVEIGENCFGGCRSLHRLRFVFDGSPTKIVGDVILDAALERDFEFV